MTLTVAGEPLIAFLLASIRILAWLAVVPPFSGRTVPPMAKVVLSLGLAFAVAPAGDAIPLDTVGLLFNVGTQVLVGVAMGFVTQLLLAAIATAGSLIDVFGGFSLAQGFDPLSMNQNTVFGKLPPDARDRAAVRQRRTPAGHRRAAADLPLPAARDHPGLERGARPPGHGVQPVLRHRRADRAADDRRALPGRPRAWRCSPRWRPSSTRST